ncbi:hypothetical protein L204_102234 [Cryptococcus depauperatus]
MSRVDEKKICARQSKTYNDGAIGRIPSISLAKRIGLSSCRFAEWVMEIMSTWQIHKVESLISFYPVHSHISHLGFNKSITTPMLTSFP